MEPISFTLLVTFVGIALLFDFLNGLHDAANSIATIVSTRMLQPQYAVAWAAFFNFIAFTVFGVSVAKTVGSKITRLSPQQGFCAETGGAITLFLATHFGVPVSTTHTITGAIIGVGAARRVSTVRWIVARNIVIAWIITLPATAVLGGRLYTLAHVLLF